MPPDDAANDSTIPPLPQDNGTPFSPADPVPEDTAGTPDERAENVPKLDDTHPATDTNIQASELYEEGLLGAAEANEPNLTDNVTGYGGAGYSTGNDGDVNAVGIGNSDGDDVDPDNDSPETLDEAISQGDEREHIDPSDMSSPGGVV